MIRWRLMLGVFAVVVLGTKLQTGAPAREAAWVAALAIGFLLLAITAAYWIVVTIEWAAAQLKADEAEDLAREELARRRGERDD